MKPEQANTKAWKLILAAVQELRAQKMTLEQIGALCGAAKGTVQRWEAGTEGGEKTPFVNMLRYMKGLNIPLEKLLEKKISTPPFVPDDTTSHGGLSASELQERELTILNVHAVAGAGPAWEEASSEPMFSIAVPARYIRPQISAIFVSGSSMEPTILNNAVVGVNKEQREIVQGEIYAVRLPYEGIVVKRVYLDHERKYFVLRSDNRRVENEFPDIRIPFDDDTLFIYGKVAWVLQSYEKQ